MKDNLKISDSPLSQFLFRAYVKNGEAYLVCPSSSLFAYFHAKENDFKDGIVTKLRKDGLNDLAQKFSDNLSQNAPEHIDFQFSYTGFTGSNKIKTISIDAYFESEDAPGCVYNFVGIDASGITERENRIAHMAKDLQFKNQLVHFIKTVPSQVMLCKVHNIYDLQPIATAEAMGLAMGFPKEEIPKYETRDVYEFIHPDDRQKVQDFVSQFTYDRSLRAISYRLVTYEGEYIWFAIDAIGFTVSEQRYIYFHFTSIDSLKTRELYLQHEYSMQQSYLSSVQSKNHGIVRFNLTTDTVEKVKHTGMVFLPGQMPTTYTQSMDMLVSAIVDPQVRKHFAQASKRKVVIDIFKRGDKLLTREFEIQTPSGQRIWIRVSMSHVVTPFTSDIIAIADVINITTDVLKHNIYNSIVTRRIDNIYYFDIQKQRWFYDIEHIENAEGLTDIQLFKAIQERLSDDEDVEDIRNKLNSERIKTELEHAESFSVYYTCSEHAKDIPGNPQRHIRDIFYYLDDKKDIIVCTQKDVTLTVETERKNRENLTQALKDAQQASKAKSEFLSRMSHEIRTPMNAIIGLVSIAMEEPGLTSQLHDYLSKIDVSAHFLLSLINDILDMSRIESGKIVLSQTQFNMDELLDGIHTIIIEQCKAKGLTYDYAIKNKEYTSFIGDKTKLQQILINILGNAVKFTPAGGSVLFNIEQENADNGKMLLRFTIQDSGIGIKSDFLTRIFEPFYQENRPQAATLRGTGLGLTISQKLAQLMGGNITVESEQNVGSTFTVEVVLQIAQDDTKTDAKDVTIRSTISDIDVDFTGRRILLVEDNLINIEIAKLLLEKKHCEVVTAQNGEVGVTSFEQSVPGYFSMILMDIQMPVMNGFEATQAIRASNHPDAKSIPIIAMTANAFQEDVKKSLESGMNDHVAKPIEPSRMYSVIQTWL